MSDLARVAAEWHGDTPVGAVTGEVDASNVAEVGVALRGLVTNESSVLIVDLSPTTYLDSADSLRGNVYKLTGTVGTQLAWAPREGRLYAVEVNERNDILALLIPATFNSLNIQKGQHYFFKIEVGEKGILRVRDLRKV